MFLKISLKSNIIIQITIKNDEEWHLTSIFKKTWGLSFKGLNSPWTNSKCIFFMKVSATSITYFNIIGTNCSGICHWQCLLYFWSTLVIGYGNICEFPHNFKKFLVFVDILSFVFIFRILRLLGRHGALTQKRSLLK